MVYFDNIVMEVYIWLSYKYEREFVQRELAQKLKNLVCEIIEKIIERTGMTMESKRFKLL
jgi:hypothetical protein